MTPAKAPVSVCLIVKNESGQLDACLRSLRPHVAEICVVDTGSTDDTPGIAKRYADRFESYTGCNDKDGLIASFSDARQRSFDLATQPWVLWVDGDDDVVGADRIHEVVDRFEQERAGNPALILLPYEYSHDHLGNVTCLHYRERFASPKDRFKWIGPVHEVLNPQEPGTHMFRTDAIKIVHRRHQSGKVPEANRNLRILKAHYDRAGESDVRQLYYLGLEYANSGDLGNSIKFHKRYVELSGWDDEKCLACMEIAKHYQTMGDYDNAVTWSLRAITVREKWAEPYLALAKSYYFMAQRGGPDERRNWERCVHFCRVGLSMPPTETILFVNPLERTHEIQKFLNLALNRIGDVSGALESVNLGLSVRPDDENLKLNKALYQEFLEKQKVRDATRTLLSIGSIDQDAFDIINETLEGRFKVRKVPASGSPGDPISQSEMDLASAEPPAAGPPAHGPAAPPPTPVTAGRDGPLDVILYVGPGVEPWSPDTFQQAGIGGSETMAWEMSRRLARLGNKVRLFGHCQGMEGTYDGVEFLNYDKYRDVRCDVLVTSRRPQAVDAEFRCEAKARLCWVHDVTCGPELTHARSLRIDRFLVLSNWHRDFFMSRNPFVHPSQMIVTRNGIDLGRFSDGGIRRNPHRAVYSSSPDRGLDVAMRAMPLIRERVPDAELHVFYGFKTWSVSAVGDPGQMKLIECLKDTLRSGRDGIFNHDRVNQVELAKEFLKSGVWMYPTWFTETSCITAMEAQAAGLRIVTSPIAALNETVNGRGTMIHGDWLSPDYMSRFVDAVVDAMTRSGDGDRQELQQYARSNFGLDALASDWDATIRTVIAEVERDVVPRYKPAR